MVAQSDFRPFIVAVLFFGVGRPAAAQTATDSPVPGPRTVLTEAAKDFVGLASLESLTVLSSGAVAAAAVHPADHNVNWQLHGADYQFLTSGRVLGSAAVQGGAAVALYLVGRSSPSHTRVGAIGQDLIRAQLVTQATTLTLKVAVRRDRPDGNGHLSFPSGHSSMTFATATILDGHFGWKVSIPAYLVATYVATSRLHENRHNASDVVFGAAIGIAAGRVTLRRARSRVLVQPTATVGGAGLTVTW